MIATEGIQGKTRNVLPSMASRALCDGDLLAVRGPAFAS